MGWFERHVCEAEDGSLQYVQSISPDSTGVYGIVLTKGAVMHSKFLAAYTDELPQWMHAFVKANRNCEDIAMQYLVSSKAKEPPWDLPNRFVQSVCVPNV